MTKYNSLLLISTSDTVNYQEFSKLSLDRFELYENITNFRMIHFDGGFRSPLDILNKCIFDSYYSEADECNKKDLYSIWNLTTANGLLAVNQLIESGVDCSVVPNFDSYWDYIKNYINEHDCPVVGISTTFILNWSEIGRIIKKIRSFSEKAKIVLGGSFISSNFMINGVEFFTKAVKKYNIDCILTSPYSEQDLPSLFRALNDDIHYDEVPNLIYVGSQGQVILTDIVHYEPIISYGVKALERAIDIAYRRTLQIRTSVGCPYSCKFCSYSNMSDFVCEDLAKIDEELCAISMSGAIDTIVFIDDNLNCPPKRFDKLLDILNKHKFRWYGFIRIQYIDDAIAERMRESGCDGVYLGLESGSNKILEAVNKQAKTEDYSVGMQALKKAGIKSFASFIVGLPGESEETVCETVEFLNKGLCDYYALKEYFYDHNSPITNEADSYELTGVGNKWSHKTMNSIDASIIKKKMYYKVTNSMHVDSDYGMWYLVYLRINGYSWDTITVIQKCLNELINCDLAGDYSSERKEVIFNSLKNHLESNSEAL